METAERATILGLLNESSQAMESAVSGVSEEKAKLHPQDGCWSIAEIVEHVAVAEEQMFFVLTEKFRPAPPAPPNEEKEAKIRDAMLNRDEKMVSPEPSRPSGRFASLSAGLAHFRACRAKTIHYVEQCKDNLRNRSVKHPLAGIVTGYEYLLILALHPSRHAAQIRTMRETLDN